jgi:hypothetical protein
LTSLTFIMSWGSSFLTITSDKINFVFGIFALISCRSLVIDVAIWRGDFCLKSFVPTCRTRYSGACACTNFFG